ncbi:hypothetical protein VNO77_19890 [Canavalia gladiata]|uniref:Uncharacterized protein n=1 Tax=Canavalia gladiata TaxID=3824 RepID=A0AAN9LRR1_CANGL
MSRTLSFPSCALTSSPLQIYYTALHLHQYAQAIERIPHHPMQQRAYGGETTPLVIVKIISLRLNGIFQCFSNKYQIGKGSIIAGYGYLGSFDCTYQCFEALPLLIIILVRAWEEMVTITVQVRVGIVALKYQSRPQVCDLATWKSHQEQQQITEMNQFKQPINEEDSAKTITQSQGA